MVLEVFERWGSKQWPGPWRARGARAYNGGLGAEPPAGSKGRAPGGGSGGRSLPEAESFLVLERPTEWQNSKMSKSIGLSLTSQCRSLKLLGEQELWPALPCQKLGQQLLPLLPLFQRPFETAFHKEMYVYTFLTFLRYNNLAKISPIGLQQFVKTSYGFVYGLFSSKSARPPAASPVKKCAHNRKLQFSGRQLQNYDRGDYGCLTYQFSP